MIRAAGLMLTTRDGRRVLYLQHCGDNDRPAIWEFPGGMIEEGETPLEAAEREVREEIGAAPYDNPVELTRRVDETEGVDYTTFHATVAAEFTPTLSPEHCSWTWAPVDTPPEPLQPGCRVALQRPRMTELDVGRAIAAGELTSPQTYENVTIFAIRITGTGKAYRHKLNEFVWRDPALYLNDEFLARCAGLPVIVEHPKAEMLDSKEFAARIVGTISFAYIRGEEVWGIAKIWDADTAEVLRTDQLSTSPAVVFRDPSVNVSGEMEDGSRLLIEGKPSLLDHLALCAEGVWDKGKEPKGVDIGNFTGVRAMADEATTGGASPAVTAAADSTALAEAIAARVAGMFEPKFVEVTTALNSVSGRLDSVERSTLARRDAGDTPDGESNVKGDRADTRRRDEEETEEEKAAREKREREEKDAAAREDKRVSYRDRFSHRRDGDDDDTYRGRHDAEEKELCEDLKKGGDVPEAARDRAKAARRDAETEEEKERKDAATREDARRRADAAARADAQVRADYDARLTAVERATREVPVADRVRLAETQARADSVYRLFSQQAPAAMSGETLPDFRRRLLRGLQKHSKGWKDIDLHGVPDNVLDTVAEQQIFADAQNAARAPADVPFGQLREVKRTDVTGRSISEFYGDPLSWMHSFMIPQRRVTRFLTDRNRESR